MPGPVRRSGRPRRGRPGTGLFLSAALLLAGCTGSFSGGLGLSPTGSGAPTALGSGAGTGLAPLGSVPRSPVPGSPAPVSPVPVTPDGLVTGPGVTDSTITLGLLVDAAADRGFVGGARLWGRIVNADGGICGRQIDFAGGTTATIAASYRREVPAVLGLLALPARADPQALTALVSADQVPTLEPSGSSAGLSATGPVILGATADVAAINALAYLDENELIPAHAAVTVVADSSPEGANAAAGARWWAARAGATVTVTDPGKLAALAGAQAVLVEAGSGAVSAVLAASNPDVPVVTTLDGLPTPLPDPGSRRLLVTSPTPAFGSDHPAAAAVARAFTAAAGPAAAQPGPRLLAGYAVAATWGRLLTRACATKTLTRGGIVAAMAQVGPASVDSLLGPSDPGLVLTSALPATRVSSMARVDPAAPGGLAALEWMAAAPGIADYTPAR